MTKKVLLVGRRGVVIDDVQHQLEQADIQLFGGTSIEDVRSAFAQSDIDHVILGAGSSWKLVFRSSGKYFS